jgi:outer membrane receptor protein involved in Fe transport
MIFGWCNRHKRGVIFAESSGSQKPIVHLEGELVMSSGFAGRAVRTFLVVCAILCMGLAAMAQSSTEGAIGGFVNDPQKAVVPGATITVLNLGTGKEDSGTTDSAGRFRVIHLQPNVYSVTVNATGFTPYKQDKVTVEVGRVTELEVTLGVAGTSQTVEVLGEAPVIQTEQQDFNSNVNQVSISELPINGRRWSQYALLTPGTAPDGDFGLITFRGISGLLNNNTVDGADNNQAFFAEEKGRTRLQYSTSQASIQEFQVNTSNFSAEYGRAAGGVVNSVTKSGGNRLHGEAFYYIRDNELGATNPFSVQSVIVNGVVKKVPLKPVDRRQQWGGALGGRLIKDKLFFFFSYDQQARNFPGVGTFASPDFLDLKTLGAADATKLAANNTPAQTAAGLAFLQGITGVVPRRGDQVIVFPKLDWQVNKNNRLTLSYNRLRWDSPAGIQTQAVVARGVASFGDDFVKGETGIVRLTSAISPTVSNEFRYQYGRDFEYENSQPPGPGEPATGPGGRPPDVLIDAFGRGIEIGKPTFLERKALPDEKRNQFTDTLAWSFGKHLLKVGADINHVYDLQDNLRNEGGSYSYSSLTNFLIDFANPSKKQYSSYTQAFGPTAFHFTTNDFGFFVQDDFHATSRLTLNLGVRYEYEQLPDPQIPNPTVAQTNQFPHDKNNIGPRAGFAWDMFGDGKTALRGGYGIYYGRIINSTIVNAITNTGVPASQLTFSLTNNAANAPCTPILPAVLSAPPTCPSSKPDIQFFQNGYQAPMIHEADLVLEREVARNTVVRMSYLVSLGRKLPLFIDTNLNVPTSSITYLVTGGGPFNGQSFTTPLFTGARPNTNFGRMTAITSAVSSRYDGAVIEVNRRFTGGLQFGVNYTWSHATDTGQSSQTFTTNNNLFNVFDVNREAGNSNFDFRHRFVANVVYSPQVKFSNRVLHALLEGYTVSPIVQATTGRAVTAFIGGNAVVATGVTTPSTGLNGSGGTQRPFWIGRNTFHQPNTYVVDLRLSRRFKIREGKDFEVLAEAFNLLNHVNITGVANQLYRTANAGTAAAPIPTLAFDSSFLTNTAAGATLYNSRQIQFAARVHF